MGKYSVFISSRFHQAIPMLFPIRTELEYFPLPWDSHGTHRMMGPMGISDVDSFLMRSSHCQYN